MKTCRELNSRLSSHAIGNMDKSYKPVWHSQLAKSMKILRKTFGHLSSVYCLIFDRSGRLVITGADDMLVKVWSFVDARLIHTFRGASAEISDLAVSSDNKLIGTIHILRKHLYSTKLSLTC